MIVNPAALSRALCALLLMLGALLHAAVARAQNPCPGEPLCREVPSFTATITEFRVSPNTLGNRPVNITVRFANKGQTPLIIGLVDDTARAFDDRGNEYALQNSRKLTGIGLVERNRFDPKFTLAPGESADARMEVNFHVGRNVIAGTVFDLQMSIREIERDAGNAFRLGREHALSWAGLQNGSGGRAPVAATTAIAPAATEGSGESAVGTVLPAGDPCTGIANCTASGALLAKVVGVQSAAPKGTNHEVTVRISFQNLGSAPMILNYKTDTGEMIDERGEKYIVDSRYRNSVQGMPVSTRTSASSQFTLRPGEARTAAFIFRRYVGRVPAGTVFSPAVAVEQYALLPSNQLQLEREYALSFGEVRGGVSAEALGDAIKRFGNLFKKKD